MPAANNLLPPIERKGFIDPLLECLVILTKLNGNPYSAESLSAGLPMEKDRINSTLFVRAAKRIGYSARVVKRPIFNISPLLLPAVVILHKRQACILTKIIDNETLEVIFPEAGDGTTKVKISELAEQYTGYSIFVKQSFDFEQRANEYQLDKPQSWFWGTLWQYRNIYYQVIFGTLLINIFTLASPLFAMNVYDRVVPNSAEATLWVLAIGISIVFLFDFALRLLRGYLMDLNGKKADIVMSSILMERVLNMRLEHKPASAGGFANNLHGFEALRDFFASATLTSLIDFPFVIIFLAAIWYLAGGLVVVPLTAIPLILLASYCIEIPARRANEETYFGNTQKQALAIEILNGLETIKSNSAEGRLLAKWEKYVSMIGRSSTRAKFFSLLAANVTNCIMQLNYVALVVVGTYMIMAGDLTLGSLIACSILSGRGLAPLGQIASVASRYHNTKLALAGLDKLMNIPVERDRGKHYVHRPKLSGDIEFKEISFCYPNQKMEALEQVSFTIKARERVAILGRNGSGKSTILKLIAGLYQPLHGHIRVDGTDIAQMDPAELRHNIGYVSQDVLLFYGNMRDNIIMSAPWADDAAILNACQLSGVDNFVKRHPLGYDMRIGERGEGISGGQRQAVGIARTLLPNPPILLFDEPSASMDNSSEQEFIRNLSTIIADKTLILVTHKPQMLSLVNRVIVIDNAHIVADGPKDHILNALSQNKIKAVDS